MILIWLALFATIALYFSYRQVQRQKLQRSLNYFDEGKAHFNNKKYSRAIDLFTKSIRAGHHIQESLLYKSKGLYRIQKFLDAKSSLDELIKYTPDSFEALSLRAKTSFELKDYERVVTDLNKTSSTAELPPDLYLIGGKSNQHLENFQKAIYDFTYYLKAFPNDHEVLVDRALCFCKSNKFQLAAEDLELAIELDGNNGEYWASLGYVLLALKKKQLAKEKFIRAYELGDKSVLPLLKKDFQMFLLSWRGEETIIELTAEFKQAFDLMENSSQSMFLTGKAGTGKSTLLKYFRKKSNKKFVVLAPTGIAALNVGGQTIHSFFRLPITFMDNEKVVSNPFYNDYDKLETIIIDEISMVRADWLDAINNILKKGRKSALPFGGVQMILIGDLHQLPPVLDKDTEQVFYNSYKSVFFFNAIAFKGLKLKMINLKEIHRQKDESFIELLNQVRVNQVQDKYLNLVNTRFNGKMNKDDYQNHTTLTTTNDGAKRINDYFLQKLKTDEYTFEAKVTGDFSKDSFPTLRYLVLKEGTRVMMIKNDTEKRWVNGDIGIIEKINEKKIEVSLQSGNYEIHPSTWEKIKYEYDEKEEKFVERIVGSFEQYPIKLAWAITIHKSQGQTFDEVLIDFGAGAFAHGQAYVALSRIRSLQGIYLLRPLRQSDFITDPIMYEYQSIFSENHSLMADK